jgi:phenylpyruvate tautomerase PptA (4-oxalocrotonate tautomerase family)
MVKRDYVLSDVQGKQEANMPLVRVSLRRGKPAAYRKAILDGIYQAMISTFNVPNEDRFMVINEHDEPDFSYSPTYLGINRTDDLILIQLTVSNTRGVEQKKALFRQIVENLRASPGVRPEDVFINLVEVVPANWSFGNGIAQYVAEKT